MHTFVAKHILLTLQTVIWYGLPVPCSIPVRYSRHEVKWFAALAGHLNPAEGDHGA